MEDKKRLVETIKQMILDLDAELGTAPDMEYRKQILKAIYSLRDLDLFIYMRLTEDAPLIGDKDNSSLRWPALN
jgi:hypothetical protein